jgi:LysM repeat protein
MREEEWPPFPEGFLMADVHGAAPRRFSREHAVFRIGAAVTGCLTMAVFLWAVAKLPVRDAVSAVQLPSVKSPLGAQTPAAPAGDPALASVAPAGPSPIFATAIPTLAPTAVPTIAPTTVPTAAPKAAASPASSPAPSSGADAKSGGTYAVQPGDTLFSIARRHGIAVQALASANNISDASLVKAGEQLKVPKS